MYICICNKVTDNDIHDACENGACSIECLQKMLKVATCCGRCKDCATRTLRDAQNLQMRDNQQLAIA